MPGLFPQDIQAAFATVLVDEWVRAGVTDAVACPGSRSTPLLVALAEAAEVGRLRLHMVLDERGAGFFALGLGMSSGTPAVVVTTSGTAAVELHPAVVEAHHAGVPLLAVTADRPPELHDCGAPQTVRQVGLYGPAVRWGHSPGVPEAAAAGTWRSLAARAVAEARGGAHRPGPVHLNLAFREPLLGSPAGAFGDAAGLGNPIADVVRTGRPDGGPWHRVTAAPDGRAAPDDVVRRLAAAGEKGLIVAGRGAGDPRAVWDLSEAASWPVLADPTSGCRRPGAIAAADSLLRTSPRQWQPDVVLRLGAPWASRVVGEWLGELACPQFLVDPRGSWAAPDRTPGDVVVADPAALCRQLAAALGAPGAPSSSAWAETWAQAEAAAQAAIDATLGHEAAMTEPGIARTLVGSPPDGTTLMVSSSMPVRDVEWWSRPREGLRVLANRGANGIDGVVSTALGVAASLATGAGPGAGARRAVALIGDLAFVYDAGALLWAAERELDLDIVVVDNDGGGIFSFLPQAGAQPPARFERLWGTPHGVDLCSLARSYGAPAESVPDLGSLAQAVARPAGRGARVLVAKVDRSVNVEVQQRLHRAVATAVSGLA